MKKIFISASLLILIFIAGCKNNTANSTANNDNNNSSLTPGGVYVEDYKNWLNSIQTTDFDKKIDGDSLILTPKTTIDENAALNSIKTSLKALAQDKIIIDIAIDQLTWDSALSTLQYKIIKVKVRFADGYIIGEDLAQIIPNNEFKIQVMIKNTTDQIAVIGAGSSSNQPVEVYIENILHDELFIIQKGTYIIESPIKASPLTVVAPDTWNIPGIENIIKNGNVWYNSQLSQNCDITLDAAVTKLITDSASIAKGSSQLYKTTLTVNYKESVTGETKQKVLDLYLKLIK